MAYDNNGFMEKLRLNNVFPAEGQGNPSPLIGMPEFKYPRAKRGVESLGGGGGKVSKKKLNPNAGVLNFERGIKPPQELLRGEPPKNTAWVPGAADINAGRMVMGETPRDEHQRSMELQGPKYSIQQQNANTNRYKADITNFKAQNPNMKFMTPKGGNIIAFDPLTGQSVDTGISTGSMSELDKQELIGEQAAGRNDASIAGRENVANINNLASGQRNDASIAGRANVAGMNNTAAGQRNAANNEMMQPTQQRVDQNNEARRLAQDPYLAQFIQIDPNGNFAIIGNPPLDALSKIQNAIYKPRDIALPNESGAAPQQSATPTSKTPTANMSLPSQSKYKVSVE